MAADYRESPKRKPKMSEEARKKRMLWHSRRGMLELDLLLVPYAESRLPGMDQEALASYETLLGEEDQDLFLWLTGRAEAPLAGLQAEVQRIRRFNAGER